jgi:hypothetical protein
MLLTSRKVRYAGHAALVGGMRRAYDILVGTLEWKRPLGRPRRRWEGDIRMDLREVVDSEHLSQDGDQWLTWRTLVNTVMNLRVP